LRTVARWAQHWNVPFARPADFVELRDVLAGHCDRIGRDPADITCSVQVSVEADADLKAKTDEAAALLAVGVDVVIFTMRDPYRVSTVERLATALS
jgi:alkanesulfonate monooxygenase SsuD/methylene tetrahydromethanopterin reductase-like flavin-dependent oxidoreductase (luciferase family)